MLPLFALLAQTDDLSADARLKAPLTVEERYLPLPEFAQRLQSATKVSIALDTRVKERKLTLFVTERSASEAMARVADALGARWAPSEGGWRLSADPNVAQEESAESSTEDAVQTEALSAWIQRKIDTEPNESDWVERALRQVLTKVGPQRTAAMLLEGRMVAGTGDGRWGTAAISVAEAFSDREMYTPEGTKTPTNGMLQISRDPLTGHIRYNLRSLGVGDSVASLGGSADPIPRAPGEPSALSRRMAGWAKEADPVVAATPLRTLPPKPDPYGSGMASLADVLARLHERSGVPVAAESFRAPVASWGDAPGGTVREVLASVSKDRARLRAGGPRFVWRSESGWLLAKFPRAWALRPGEIAEKRLLPLEDKGTPTLEDYASLAGSLTPAQRSALESYRPLANFSTLALRYGFWGLWVYDVLPMASRRRVREGISFSDLPQEAQNRWDEAVRAIARRDLVPESWMPSMFGAGARPPAAGFQLADTRWGTSNDHLKPSADTSDSTMRHYTAWGFRFGLDRNPISVVAPIAPEAGSH